MSTSFHLLLLVFTILALLVHPSSSNNSNSDNDPTFLATQNERFLRTYTGPIAAEVVTDVAVASFSDPPKTSLLLFLDLYGIPALLEQNGIHEIEMIFEEAFDRQRLLVCGPNSIPFFNIEGVEILVNEIDGFGDEPRTIESPIDFSYFMAVNYTCAACQPYVHLFESSIGPNDPRNSYQVPFPSAIDFNLKPCLPDEIDVINDFKMSVLAANISGIISVEDLGSIADQNDIEECLEGEQTNFTAYITLAILGDYESPDFDYHVELFEQAIVETYNQINILNSDTCDPHSKVLLDAHAELRIPAEEEDDELRRKLSNAGEHQRRRLTNKKHQYPWFFMYAGVDGSCNGCPADACATNDVSGHATCEGSRRRRHLQESMEEGSSCLCAGNEYPPPLTNEDLQIALEETFAILRNQTNFTLVDSIVYAIEVDVPESCCGWPVNGNVPVMSDLPGAIQSYIDNDMTSIHGRPINCWDITPIDSFDSAFASQADFNEPIGCWDTSEVTSFYRTFYYAESFNQDLTFWDTDKVMWFESMFEAAYAFNGDVSGFNISSSTDLSTMFYEAYEFNRDLSSWDTSAIVNMDSMFGECVLFNGDVSTWDTSSLTSMYGMFENANVFNSDISNWDVEKVTDMEWIFANNGEFDQDLSGWNVGNIENFRNFFEGASKISSDLSQWDVSKGTSFLRMFRRATNFNSDISSWNMSSATTLEAMFEEASSFDIDISSWDTSRVTTMMRMFLGAASFDQNIELWDVQNVVTFENMFSGATSFNQDLSSWIPTSATTFEGMFEGASSFSQDLCPWRLISTLFVNPAYDAFLGTNCPSQLNPIPGSGPFCHECEPPCCGVSNSSFIPIPSFNGETMQEIVQDYIDNPMGSPYGFPINCWDVTARNDFNGAFIGQTTFNEPLDCWDMSGATIIANMFNGASSFNQDVSGWNIEKVTAINRAFINAAVFNQDLCAWTSVDSNVLDTTDAFVGTDCTVETDPVVGVGPYCSVCVP